MSKVLTDNIIPSLKDKVLVKDTGWINLSLLNGWLNPASVPLQARCLTFSGGGV